MEFSTIINIYFIVLIIAGFGCLAFLWFAYQPEKYGIFSKRTNLVIMWGTHLLLVPAIGLGLFGLFYF